MLQAQLHRTVRAFVLLIAVTTVVTLPNLHAQSVTGTILGTVADSSGATVPNVPVVAVSILTGEKRTINTDSSGSYLFRSLPVGQYRIEAEAAGFKKFFHDGIILDVNRNARVDILLEVGQVSEKLEVVGDAAQVDTQQVQAGGLVDSRRIVDLPISGRNVYSLASILPGVAAASTEQLSTRNGNTMNVNGSRPRNSTFLLDGGFNTTLWRTSGQAAPNPDAVQEFQIITNNFNAQYGRSSGSVVNVVTRSGTNDFHGGVFEFLRNDVLNARNFFQSTVSPLRQNQFGGVFGGPLVRNKTFFFGSFETLRVRSSQFVNTARPPSAAERTGDFSSQAVKSWPNDPLTGKVFPNGMIPASRLDPVAQAMMKLSVALPNTSDGRLEAQAPLPQNQSQGVVKLDHLMTANQRLSGTLFYVTNYNFQPFDGGTNLPNFDVFTIHYNQWNGVINHTWTISPTLLNEFSFTLSRNHYDEIPDLRTSWSDWGSKVPLAAPFHKPYPPSLSVSGRWSAGAQNENMGQMDRTFTFNDTVSWNRGKHNVKVGTWFATSRYEALLALAGSGIVGFTGSFTGNALGDYLLGQAASFRQSSGTNRKFQRWDWESFIQDDWKISRRVTLNLGMRYELAPRFHSLLGDIATFRPGAQSKVIPSAPAGLQFVGDPGIPDSMAKLDRNNFAPRVGLAIDPFGDGKTAIRAGFGFFYATPYADAATYIQQQPFQVDLTVFGTPNLVNPYANVTNPFPYTLDKAHPFFVFPITADSLAANIATPYVQHYTVAIQHQLMKNLSAQLAYVGNESHKLIQQIDINQPIFIPGQSTASNVNARRPIMPGTYGQISESASMGNANFNSLQFSVDKRFAGGFSIMANYTYGKSIDTTSDDPTNPTDIIATDSTNLRYDRGPSLFDVRQVMNVSYLWELPKVKALGFFGTQILSGWQINGLTRFQSGSPVNMMAGQDVNLNGINNDRPNVNGPVAIAGSFDQRIARYFDTSMFSMPVAGSLGSAGKNFIYGPGSQRWDLAVLRIFAITERHKVQLRGEAFNLPNRVNLGNPTNTFTSSNFGRILSAGSARVIQFGLKYNF